MTDAQFRKSLEENQRAALSNMPRLSEVENELERTLADRRKKFKEWREAKKRSDLQVSYYLHRILQLETAQAVIQALRAEGIDSFNQFIDTLTLAREYQAQMREEGNF